jgi:hypothetical protein
MGCYICGVPNQPRHWKTVQGNAEESITSSSPRSDFPHPPSSFSLLSLEKKKSFVAYTRKKVKHGGRRVSGFCFRHFSWQSKREETKEEVIPLARHTKPTEHKGARVIERRREERDSRLRRMYETMGSGEFVHIVEAAL